MSSEKCEINMKTGFFFFNYNFEIIIEMWRWWILKQCLFFNVNFSTIVCRIICSITKFALRKPLI